MFFPITRLRRLRMSAELRDMVRENEVNVKDLIAPLFIVPGSRVREEIPSLPGQYRLSIDLALEEAAKLYDLGLPAVLLFGIPEQKDDQGLLSCAADGIIQRCIIALKQALPKLIVITDVCLCEYTSHGHCGVLKNGTVDNDQTLEILVKQSLSHARAGADILAPSSMMDGCVGAMRQGLDQEGFDILPIMAYAAKYASAFYGPFRDAVQSAPQFGDRKSHQLDPANLNEGIREVELDLEEGADIVMVKPALAYLDLIRVVKERFHVPTAAYNVSGEYAMIKAAAANGWVDGPRIMLEVLTSIKRAGADLIISYFAEEFARLSRGTR